MKKIKKISDFNFNSKKVLVRLDLNVPIKNKKILDETRIISSIPTLKEIIRKKGAVSYTHLTLPTICSV